MIIAKKSQLRKSDLSLDIFEFSYILFNFGKTKSRINSLFMSISATFI